MPSYFFWILTIVLFAAGLFIGFKIQKESCKELISRLIRYFSFIFVFFLIIIFTVFSKIEMNLKIIILTYYLGVYLLIKLRSTLYKCDNSLKECKETIKCDYNISNLYSKIIFMLFLFGGILSTIIVFLSAINFILPKIHK